MINSNKEDLRLIEEMGIKPDIPQRKSKATLRTVGMAVIAMVRLKKMQLSWAASKKLQESLLRKLEQVRSTSASQQLDQREQRLKLDIF